MAIENCEKSIPIAYIYLMDGCIFHALSPTYFPPHLPCISEEQYAMFFLLSEIVFFRVMGSERYTPISEQYDKLFKY